MPRGESAAATVSAAAARVRFADELDDDEDDFDPAFFAATAAGAGLVREAARRTLAEADSAMAPLAASAEQADARNESRTAAPAFDDVPPPPAPAAATAFVPPTRAAREAVIEIERSRAVATALGRGSGRVDARKHAARRRRDERSLGAPL